VTKNPANPVQFKISTIYPCPSDQAGLPGYFNFINIVVRRACPTSLLIENNIKWQAGFLPVN
jgi:hypothetical protein